MGKSWPVGERHSAHRVTLHARKKAVRLKPLTEVARNLLVINLLLDVPIAPDGLQKKFQHAEYFTCNPLIPQRFFIQFSTINLGFSQLFQ